MTNLFSVSNKQKKFANSIFFCLDFYRQTMVLVFYLLCIILMMLSRPILNTYLMKKGKMAVYSALYFFPILALFHTIIGGLMCTVHIRLCILKLFIITFMRCFFIFSFTDYAFPYLSIIISMISNAAHFSMKLDQSMKGLFLSSITETKNCIIIGNVSYFFFFFITSILLWAI